jgi:hypothetical protein
MARIDERQEAIAFIRMTIDNARNKKLHEDAERCPELDDDQELDDETDLMTEHTWRFGSAEGRRMTSRALEAQFASLDRDYTSFDQRLRDFIAHNLPEDALRYEDEVYVSDFHHYALDLCRSWN